MFGKSISMVPSVMFQWCVGIWVYCELTWCKFPRWTRSETCGLAGQQLMNATSKVIRDDDTLALPDDHAAYGAVDVGVDHSYSSNHELRHRRRRRNKYVGFAMVCRIMRYAIVRDWDEWRDSDRFSAKWPFLSTSETIDRRHSSGVVKPRWP